MCGGEWWRRRRPDRLLMLVVDVVAAHDAARYWEHRCHRADGVGGLSAMHWCCCLAGRAASMCFRGCRRGAGIESLWKRRGLAAPPRPQTCRGLALGQRLIASPCSADHFERFWRRPSRCVSRPRRAPRCLEKARTRDAAAPGPCGLGFGAAADEPLPSLTANADEHSSSHRREEATRKQQAPWPRARRRRALQGQPRGQPHTWTGHAVAARVDQGR